MNTKDGRKEIGVTKILHTRLTVYFSTANDSTFTNIYFDVNVFKKYIDRQTDRQTDRHETIQKFGVSIFLRTHYFALKSQ